MSKSKNSKAMKRGSAQHKGYMAELDAKALEEREVRAHGNRQMMADAIALALHEQLHFGGKRIERFISAVSDKLDEICRTVTTDYKADKKFEYAKADYDGALQQAYGKKYSIVPFNLRFCPDGWHCVDGETIKKVAQELQGEERPFAALVNEDIYMQGYEAGRKAALGEMENERGD